MDFEAVRFYIPAAIVATLVQNRVRAVLKKGEQCCWRIFGRLSIGLQGKKEWLGFLELKDPGAVLELIAVMELGIVRGSIDPHFVDDFEPAVSESAQGIGVALVLLAMVLIVNLGPDAARETLLSKKVEGAAAVSSTSPAMMHVPVFALFPRTLSHRCAAGQALEILR